MCKKCVEAMLVLIYTCIIMTLWKKNWFENIRLGHNYLRCQEPKFLRGLFKLMNPKQDTYFEELCNLPIWYIKWQFNTVRSTTSWKGWSQYRHNGTW